MNTSRKIDFEGLNNTRDLGGMLTADGKKIREGLLYRSGALYRASEKDLNKLTEYNLCRIYDFREEDDREHRPDPDIPGCSNLWIPILMEDGAGVEQGEKAQEEAYKMFRNLIENPEQSAAMMTDIYRQFIREEYCRKQYGRFIKDILSISQDAQKEGKEPVILWHCAAGKDRAGFGAVILQEIFGVSREDIFADYMLTNSYVMKEVEAQIEKHRSKLMEFYGDQTEKIFPSYCEVVANMMEARTEYLEAVYQCVKEDYEDFSSYGEKGLNISESEQAELRSIFLEEA